MAMLRGSAHICEARNPGPMPLRDVSGEWNRVMQGQCRPTHVAHIDGDGVRTGEYRIVVDGNRAKVTGRGKVIYVPDGRRERVDDVTFVTFATRTNRGEKTQHIVVHGPNESCSFWREVGGHWREWRHVCPQ
jgi:hypothetical protein